jgi:hypothetical protein
MQTLAVAIERKHWELAALCLLLGLTEAAAKLPPEAIEGLLEVLAADGESSRRRGRSRHDPSR